MIEYEQVQSSLHRSFCFVVKSNKKNTSWRVLLIDNPYASYSGDIQKASRSNPIILFADLNQEADRTYIPITLT